MVSVLAVGLVSGIGALRARRYLDDDIIANGGVPDEVIGGDPPELPSEDERAKHPADR